MCRLVNGRRTDDGERHARERQRREHSEGDRRPAAEDHEGAALAAHRAVRRGEPLGEPPAPVPPDRVAAPGAGRGRSVPARGGGRRNGSPIRRLILRIGSIVAGSRAGSSGRRTMSGLVALGIRRSATFSLPNHSIFNLGPSGLVAEPTMKGPSHDQTQRRFLTKSR